MKSRPSTIDVRSVEPAIEAAAPAGRVTVAVTMAAMRKHNASIAIAPGGPNVVAATPPRSGPAIPMTVPTLTRVPVASAMESRPTSAGTTPKEAASKNTNSVEVLNETSRRWAIVTDPNRCAAGILASAHTLAS